MDTTPKKGMSKGCLIALIVALAVVVLLIAIVVLIHVYREDLAKVGAGATVIEVKKVLAQNPPEGIDTVRFNALADAFAEKIKLDTTAEFESLGLFVQQMTKSVSDKKLDKQEVDAAATAMIAAYPDLRQYWNPAPADTSTATTDSASSK